MAGHSKWANIKHQKKKEDRKRAKLFSKLSKRIAVEAREGGGDPEKNPNLRMAIQKAKDNNMPKDNIQRAIDRGTGNLDGVEYERIIYEGYGPAGVALYFDLMSDNRNRTASELRHLLSQYDGNLGEKGCVAWMFDRKGQLIIDRTELEVDEDDVMMSALEAGAEDISIEEQVIEIITEPSDLEDVRTSMEEDSYKFSSGDVVMIPENTVKVDNKKDAQKVLDLMDEIEDHDDVQDVYSNFDIPDEIIEELENED
ncbi:YebC/PmpR family DNA-binding transcriptional regulator [Sporohalobacter salinus]|uniref:YebC/PmpR family DNA-binding transcriptional regulator n=1 Tax=Sporohalobacter salinus TaxID=1494606 RepID=UPI0019606A6F|nr:YebC/PmpR family DNA-binding transcriptional regulator [Sporohalobacter salinus]MBM7623204.1 YebC/PmpR family DNA-binding regulatory protein [Sporohalobacter salinus]